MCEIKYINAGYEYIILREGKELGMSSETLRYIGRLEREIERLTELCNKYEEEHKTTFETWQKDIKENEQLHSIIKEVREKIESVQALGLRSGKTFIVTLLNDILELLDKVGSDKE